MDHLLYLTWRAAGCKNPEGTDRGNSARYHFTTHGLPGKGGEGEAEFRDENEH